MINIVIPMAGEGSRFVKAGYENPKPIIDVDGKPMIERVMENLFCKGARFILIGLKSHSLKTNSLISRLQKMYDTVFIEIDKITEGTACTVLFARSYINNDEPLLIANSDQLIDIPIQDFVDDCFKRKLDGSILTFTNKERDPKWSFAKVNGNGLVTEVQEKNPISEYATVGVYLFSKGSDFVNAAIDMIINKDRVNNEFYTCPTYNYLIQNNGKIGSYNIEAAQMHGLGTPDDLGAYLAYLKSISVN